MNKINNQNSKIKIGDMADLHLQGPHSIDVMVWDITEDGQHAIVGNPHHPKESYPVEIGRLTPLSTAKTQCIASPNYISQ